MLHQTTITVRKFHYINPRIYRPHFDCDWSSNGKTFQYIYRTLQHCFVIRTAAPQPHPLQTQVTKRIMIHSAIAIAHGYSWLCVQETHTIMLEGQNFNECSWGLMNSNYIDNDFTYNIYTSLRSNVMPKENFSHCTAWYWENWSTELISQGHPHWWAIT